MKSENISQLYRSFFIISAIHCAKTNESSHIHRNKKVIGALVDFPTTDVVKLFKFSKYVVKFRYELNKLNNLALV